MCTVDATADSYLNLIEHLYTNNCVFIPFYRQDMTQKDILDYFGDVPESIETTNLQIGGQCEGGASVSKDNTAPQTKNVIIDSTHAATGFKDDPDFQDHHSKSLVKICRHSSNCASKTSGKSDKSKGKTLDTYVMKKSTNDSVCKGVSMEEGKNPGSSAARLANYLLSSAAEDSPHHVSSESAERRGISRPTSSGNTGPCERANECDSHSDADSTDWFANLENDDLESFDEFDCG